MKNKTWKIYNLLQSKRKSIKKRSILLIVFLFGVNIYAWFVYMSNANMDVQSTVSTWKVTFYDGNSLIKELNIKTNDLYPGMSDYNKEIIIKNNSDVKAEFSYEIDKVNILGHEFNYTGADLSNVTTSLLNDYHFKTSFTPSKIELDKNDTMTFNIGIKWLYDRNSYDKLTNIYEYDSSLKYYTYDLTNYTEDTSVNSINFLTKVENGLYLESDDSDTYFGERCSIYKEKTGNDYCYSFHLKLKVEQKN